MVNNALCFPMWETEMTNRNAMMINTRLHIVFGERNPHKFEGEIVDDVMNRSRFNENATSTAIVCKCAWATTNVTTAIPDPIRSNMAATFYVKMWNKNRKHGFRQSGVRSLDGLLEMLATRSLKKMMMEDNTVGSKSFLDITR